MHDSTMLQLPLPDSSDTPDIPTHLSNIVGPLEKRAIIPCTSGQRPITVVDGMTVYETDTGHTRVWDGTRWVLPGVGLCTSGTRPNNPYKGMVIFETDTGRMMNYCGPVIGWCPPWNTAWGLVPNGDVRGSHANVSTSQVEIVRVTFDSVGHRRYLLHSKCDWQQDTGRLFRVVTGLHDASNNPIDWTSSWAESDQYSLGTYNSTNLATITTSSPGQVIIKAMAWTEGAGNVVDIGSTQLVVTDIGPSSSVP